MHSDVTQPEIQYGCHRIPENAGINKPVLFGLVSYFLKPYFETNYNMTVWLLAVNYISFTIATGLIRLHMPGVKKSRV